MNPGSNLDPNSSNQPGKEKLTWEELVLQQVRSLRFGTVEITIHEGKVIQVEKVERTRIEEKRS